MSPFAGLTVVETITSDVPIAIRLAIAMSGRIACDLGARVYRPSVLDDALRERPEASNLFAFLDRGKYESTARMHRMADVELLAGGAFPRTSATTRAFISTFPDDVAAGTHASEFTVLALGGLLDLVGDPEREPLRLGGHQLSYSAGLSAFSGVAAALCRPDRQIVTDVEVTLADVAIWLNWKSAALASLGEPTPGRSGRASEWTVLRCADGWIALVYQEQDWLHLVELLGGGKEFDDPRFATLSDRRANPAAVADLIEPRLAAMSRAEIFASARARRIPIGPVLSLDDLAVDPHYLGRNVLAESEECLTPLPVVPMRWNGDVPEMEVA